MPTPAEIERAQWQEMGVWVPEPTAPGTLPQDLVHGPSGLGELDNPNNEPEQSMLPPVWLGYLLLIAIGFVLGLLADWISGARL